MRRVAAIFLVLAFWFIPLGRLEAGNHLLSIPIPIKLEKDGSAPDFTLPALNGGKVRLKGLRGKVVFINFWATWCLPCKEEMPTMERLYQKMKGKDFTILAISIDVQGERVVRPFVEKLKLTYPILLDPKQKVAEKYRLWSLPTTYILDREGKPVHMVLGGKRWDTPENVALIQKIIDRR